MKEKIASKRANPPAITSSSRKPDQSLVEPYDYEPTYHPTFYRTALPLEAGAMRGSIGWYIEEAEARSFLASLRPLSAAMDGGGHDDSHSSHSPSPHFGFMAANGAITILIVLLLVYRTLLRLLCTPASTRYRAEGRWQDGVGAWIPGSKSLYKDAHAPQHGAALLVAQSTHGTASTSTHTAGARDGGRERQRQRERQMKDRERVDS